MQLLFKVPLRDRRVSLIASNLGQILHRANKTHRELLRLLNRHGRLGNEEGQCRCSCESRVENIEEGHDTRRE